MRQDGGLQHPQEEGGGPSRGGGASEELFALAYADSVGYEHLPRKHQIPQFLVGGQEDHAGGRRHGFLQRCADADGHSVDFIGSGLGDIPTYQGLTYPSQQVLII